MPSEEAFVDASDTSCANQVDLPASQAHSVSHSDTTRQIFSPTSFDTELLTDDADLFADFLKEIIQPGGANNDMESDSAGSMDPALKDILNFSGWDTLSSMDHDFPSENPWQLPAPFRQEALHSPRPASLRGYGTLSGAEIDFKQSLWSWTPREGEHWRSQTTELIPCLDDLVSETTAQNPQTYVCPRILSSTRHRLLSVLLSVAGEANYERVLSTFPSAATLDYLLSRDLQRRVEEPDSWIHQATFDPNLACPQLVIGLVISGAFRCGHALFWKLGLALLELHLELNLRMFSSNGRNTRLIAPIQSYVLTIEAGLWSGDSRRLEMCEAFSSSLMTMARRAGYLQLDSFKGPLPHADDSSDVLDLKWRMWVDHESRKRLAIHLLHLFTQFSLALLTPPLVTFIEMSIPLPAARSLWDASSAEDWRSAYFALENQNLSSLPLLRSCCTNFSPLLQLGDVHDARCTALAILSGLWLHVWQYKDRVNARNIAPDSMHANNALIIQSLQQETREALEAFKSIHIQLNGSMEPSLQILHEQQLMHLCISLEDVQYLAGKAGETEARRVLQLLNVWVSARASRQAIWHAGQIIRAGRQELNPTLRASTVIAVYHASLTLWVYSILSTSQQQLQGLHVGGEPLALMDGGDTPAVQRFLLMSGAKAAITCHTGDMQPIRIHISQTPTIMATIASLLWETYRTTCQRECPSLVDNLTRLMDRLGRAAESIHYAADLCNLLM